MKGSKPGSVPAACYKDALDMLKAEIEMQTLKSFRAKKGGRKMYAIADAPWVRDPETYANIYYGGSIYDQDYYGGREDDDYEEVME